MKPKSKQLKSAVIKNFHCSKHGYITPRPICPKCTPGDFGVCTEYCKDSHNNCPNLTAPTPSESKECCEKCIASECKEPENCPGWARHCKNITCSCHQSKEGRGGHCSDCGESWTSCGKTTLPSESKGGAGGSMKQVVAEFPPSESKECGEELELEKGLYTYCKLPKGHTTECDPTIHQVGGAGAGKFDPAPSPKQECCELCRPNSLEKRTGLDTCRISTCGCHFTLAPQEYNYDRDGSHYHCWDQVNNEDSDIEPEDTPACGQPLEKHKQCCLCNVPYVVEHCDEPNCPECNLMAYEKGRKEARQFTLQEILEEVEKMKLEAAKVRSLMRTKSGNNWKKNKKRVTGANIALEELESIIKSKLKGKE